MNLWAVVLAGGQGSRLRHQVNKVYLSVGGKDMIEYSLDTLSRSEVVAGVVVVARPDDFDRLEEVLVDIETGKPTITVGGGPTRHRSEHLGIQALRPRVESGEIDLIAVHDAARPFMTLDLLEAAATEALRRGGAVPALPVPAPLYQRGDAGAEMLDTKALRAVQTPQVFRAAELVEGYRLAEQAGFEGVDTAETVQRFTALEVALVPGDARNIKVTFVEDLLEAEDIARSFHRGRWRQDETAW